MKPKINNPHDAFFKHFYGRPAAAANFLEHNLPADIAAMIDFSTIESVKDSFVTEELERFFADLVFQCELVDGKPASVYILFEHKSAPEPACAVQVLRYMVSIWEQCLTAKNHQGDLPVVIPLVIYHGKRPWKGKPISGLFAKDSQLTEFIPDYRLLVYDLSHMPEEDIKGGLLERAVMLVMRAVMLDEPLPKIAEAVELLWGAMGPQSSLKTIEQFFRYLTSVHPTITREQIEDELAKLSEGDDIMKNFAAEFSPEAYQSGLEAGVEKGRNDGQVAGIRSTLLDLMSTRFGVLPVGLTAKLNAVQDIGTLRSLTPEALKVSSVKDFEAVVDKVLPSRAN